MRWTENIGFSYGMSGKIILIFWTEAQLFWAMFWGSVILKYQGKDDFFLEHPPFHGDSGIVSGKAVLTVDVNQCYLHFDLCILVANIFTYSQHFPAFSCLWRNMQFCVWFTEVRPMLRPFIITGNSFQWLAMLNLCWKQHYVGLCCISTILKEPLVSTFRYRV